MSKKLKRTILNHFLCSRVHKRRLMAANLNNFTNAVSKAFGNVRDGAVMGGNKNRVVMEHTAP